MFAFASGGHTRLHRKTYYSPPNSPTTMAAADAASIAERKRRFGEFLNAEVNARARRVWVNTILRVMQSHSHAEWNCAMESNSILPSHSRNSIANAI